MGVSPGATDQAGPDGSRYATWLIIVVSVALALLVGGIVVVVRELLSSVKTLTIYSSLPLHGPQARQSEDMVNAMRLALDEAEGRVGDFRVRYVSLDDSDSEAQSFTAATVAHNAMQAANDEHAAGYIGDLNSGATATAIPILSVAEIAQISPVSTAVGLTTSGPSADLTGPRLSVHRA